VFNNGNMVRDFTYIDDIVEGVTRVIDNPPSREIREANISPGAAGTQNNIAARKFSSGEEEYSADRRREVVSAPDNEKPINQASAPYKVYNIGNSSPVQLMEYIGAIEQFLGKTAQKEFSPCSPEMYPGLKPALPV
ncbi:MAG: hypothetical protein ACOCUL_00080, partial [Bacteroidota bacterium]